MCVGAWMCSLVCMYACATVCASVFMHLCLCVSKGVYAVHYYAHFPSLHVWTYIVVFMCAHYVSVCSGVYIVLHIVLYYSLTLS